MTPYKSTTIASKVPGDEGKAEIVFHPAECSPSACDDPWCPYIHHDGWQIGAQWFDTEAEASAALSRAKGA